MDFSAACKSSPWGSLVEHLTGVASNAIECSASSPSSAKAAWPLCLTLARFAHRVSVRTPLSAAVVLGACVYLRRVKARLPPSARGIPTTHHRLLLAALLISSKMLHDHQIKNCAWAKAVGLALVEVNLMERQMLGLLDFNVTLRSFELEAEFDLVNPAKFPGYSSYGSGTWPRIAPAPPSHPSNALDRVSTSDPCSATTTPKPVLARLPLAPMAIVSTYAQHAPVEQHQLTPSDPDASFTNSPSAMSICSSTTARSLSCSLSSMSVTPSWPSSPASTTLAVVSGGCNSPASSPLWSFDAPSPKRGCDIYQHVEHSDSCINLAVPASVPSASPHNHHPHVAITRLTPASPALARLGSARATTATCVATVAASRVIKASRRDSGICDIDVTEAPESWKFTPTTTMPIVAPAAACLVDGSVDGVSTLVIGNMAAGAGC